MVLQTKLNRPVVTRDLVVRSRLLQQLDAGLNGAITLVVAPAGFGKTTLITSWLQTATGDNGLPLPATWLSLDEGDDDLNVFLQYFIAALRVIYPDACPETLDLLTARQQPPIKVLRDTLSNEIAALPERFVVVLDDLHAPHGQTLFEFLNGWLHHWPRQMHLILLTRFNPPLPLSSLRVKGLLTEIRTRDLRFTQAEAAAYFSQVVDFTSDEPAVALLQQRLEGWIAGLKMASLSLGNGASLQDLASALLDQDVFIADYLIDEVVSRQSPKIQRFLLRSSILDQFSVSLAESLMDESDADCNVRDCMDYIESADLFLIPLDSHREWYRYHNLFRDVLRQKLANSMMAADMKVLHRRAAAWFFAHDLHEQAINHALEAKDLALVAFYMEQSLRDVLNREDRLELARWLRVLPEEFIQISPALLIMRAFDQGFRWELSLLAQTTEQAEALIDKNDPSEHTKTLLGLINVIKGQAYYHVNQYEQVIAPCQQALAELPEEWRYVRGLAGVYLGISLYASGRPEAAERFLAGQYESYRNKSDSYALRLLLSNAINQIQAGNYEYAERIARTMLKLSEQGHLLVIEGWANYLLGFINYEWNELDKATYHFGRVSDMFYTTQLAAARNGLIGSAYTARALGRYDEALQIIDKLSEIDVEAHGYERMDTTSARARLLLSSGNAEAAERWIHVDTFQLPDQSLIMWMEQTSLTKARILLARNRGADTQMALQILDPITDLAERSLNTRTIIEVLALRALALLNLGDSAGARKTLIRSVELARRGQFIRTFVDLGPQMQHLLHQISGHPPVSVTVGHILAAFASGESAGKPSTLLPQATSAPSSNGSNGDNVDEHLTQRELEILLLMSEPISLREIATRMTISYTTARRYTINIYSKFQVHSRWEAVEAAVQKGIINRH